VYMIIVDLTLSTFNFSTGFSAQIVENRKGRLFRPFLGPADNFSKSYDENIFVWQHNGTLSLFFLVTLSIFNFSTWFSAQIVENREGRLFRLFLGPGDNFSKSYYENMFVRQHNGTSPPPPPPHQTRARVCRSDRIWFSS
jgi:hypothetical protein